MHSTDQTETNSTDSAGIQSARVLKDKRCLDTLVAQAGSVDSEARVRHGGQLDVPGACGAWQRPVRLCG